MKPPDVTVSTREGLLGITLQHKQNTIVVLVADGVGLNDLLDWALTPQAANLIRTAVQSGQKPARQAAESLT